jgi:hypothetical protein
LFFRFFLVAAHDECLRQVGPSEMLGIACEGGSWVDQSVKRAGDPTNIKLYFDGVCVTGVMPKYGEQQR